MELQPDLEWQFGATPGVRVWVRIAGVSAAHKNRAVGGCPARAVQSIVRGLGAHLRRFLH